MKESLKKCMVKYGAVVTIAYGFAMVPMPMTTGNVTGARWAYNIWDDHKAENERARIASIDRDMSQINASQQAIGFIGMQLRLQALQNDRTHIKGDDTYTTEEKRTKADEVNRRLDRLYREIDRKGINLEDIQSYNIKQIMIAYQR